MDRFHRLSSAAVCLSALCVSLPSALNAKSHGGKNDAFQDGIEVVAHLPPTSESISHFVQTKHYRRDYLYAESSGGSSVTLIDITDVSRPAILCTVSARSRSASVVSVAGTAALVSERSTNAPASPNGQTFRITSFADPQHPTVQHEFANVSAFAHDENRSLIFLANPEGIWILHEKFAIDPAFEREWEHMALDSR